MLGFPRSGTTLLEVVLEGHPDVVSLEENELLRLRDRNRARAFVTTEKDAVNLGGYLDALAPMAVVPVKMQLADEDNAVDTMLRVIEERQRRS